MDSYRHPRSQAYTRGSPGRSTHRPPPARSRPGYRGGPPPDRASPHCTLRGHSLRPDRSRPDSPRPGNSLGPAGRRMLHKQSLTGSYPTQEVLTDTADRPGTVSVRAAVSLALTSITAVANLQQTLRHNPTPSLLTSHSSSEQHSVGQSLVVVVPVVGF